MWRRVSSGLGATVLAVSLWVGLDGLAPAPTEFSSVEPPRALAESGSVALDGVASVMAIEPTIFAPTGDGPNLAVDADAAVSGAARVAGRDVGERWEIDLTGSPVLADRIAIGLLQRGVEFERSIDVDAFGDVGSVLSGPGSIEQFNSTSSGADAVSADAARAQLGVIMELGGSPDGGLGPASEAESIEVLASSLGLAPTRVEGVPTVVSIEDLEIVASIAVTDPSRVPGLGARSAPSALAESIPLLPDSWVSATTGPLTPGADHSLSPSEGGIGWTNREAQRYDPASVFFTESGDDGQVIELRTDAVDTPSVDALPFRSGMVIADQLIGWGPLSVDVTLPAGDGLWPAVWLLDAEACEAPGRCPNYATTAYHEIDLIETRGDQPDEAHTSLHWFDERLRSTSDTEPIEPGGRVVVTVERRPGIIVWRIDGDVVYVVAGPVTGTIGGEGTVGVDAGPHRSQPMHLIINTAVGGNFAGDRILGRTGEWWGDAQVPDSFPAVGWDVATLTVHEVLFTPVD